jgi:hypothetical protein
MTSLLMFIAGALVGNLCGMLLMAILVGTHDCGSLIRYEGELGAKESEAIWDQVNAV